MEFFPQINTSDIKEFFILLDIDGTLTYDSGITVDKATAQKVDELKKNNEIVLCSNRNNHRRNRMVADLLKVKYLETNYRKPSKKILKTFSTKKPLLVIGDKFLTDAVFAKRIRARFVMVKRIRSPKETLISKVIYAIDDFCARLLKK